MLIVVDGNACRRMDNALICRLSHEGDQLWVSHASWHIVVAEVSVWRWSSIEVIFEVLL